MFLLAFIPVLIMGVLVSDIFSLSFQRTTEAEIQTESIKVH